MNDALLPTAAAATAGRALLEAEAFAVVDRVLRAELKLERPALRSDALAADLQLDSVGLLTLVVELENTFRVALREEDAAEVRTVGELCALVAARVVEGRAAITTDSVTDSVTFTDSSIDTDSVADTDTATDTGADAAPVKLP